MTAGGDFCQQTARLVPHRWTPDTHLSSPGINGVKEGKDALLPPVILSITAIVAAKRFFTGLASVKGEPSNH